MLVLAGGFFFFLNVLNFSVCGFVSGDGLVVGFLVGWGGGEGVDGVSFSSSFTYFALNSYFLGVF